MSNRDLLNKLVSLPVGGPFPVCVPRPHLGGIVGAGGDSSLVVRLRIPLSACALAPDPATQSACAPRAGQPKVKLFNSRTRDAILPTLSGFLDF